MRRFLTVIAVVEGALGALMLAVFLRVGARPCQDVFTTDIAAACAVPQAAAGAVALFTLVGGLAGLLVARRSLTTRQRRLLGLQCSMLPVDDVDEYAVNLRWDDLSLIGAALPAYLREFERHRAEDGGVSHPEEEWQQLRRRVGQLIWRLEVASAPAGATIEHSAEAVPPDDK